jgi:hypothetical protein
VGGQGTGGMRLRMWRQGKMYCADFAAAFTTRTRPTPTPQSIMQALYYSGQADHVVTRESRIKAKVKEEATDSPPRCKHVNVTLGDDAFTKGSLFSRDSGTLRCLPVSHGYLAETPSITLLLISEVQKSALTSRGNYLVRKR